jgi:hypothetical protein
MSVILVKQVLNVQRSFRTFVRPNKPDLIRQSRDNSHAIKLGKGDKGTPVITINR